ncbi:MAG: LCP family protein, partial [Sciscionella sp.]
QATAISIPRDSYVNIPGYGKHKINSAFLGAKNDQLTQLRKQGITNPAKLDVESNKAGAKETIDTVQALTGVTIDHYAQVNLIGFYDISNAIGGVPVCLKHAVNDKKYSGAVFAKGEQQVQGEAALAFVRQRHNIPGGSTDLQRERRQQAFLASMAHKVLSAGTLTDPGRLNNLLTAIKKAVVIDQGWDITSFAQQMQGLSSGRIKFTTIPVGSLSLHTPSDGTAVQVDPQTVRAFVAKQNGNAPPSPKTKPHGQAASTDTQANRATTVDVRNAGDRQGLAAAVLGKLKAKGFHGGSARNAASRQSTVIHYAPGDRAAAMAVSAALGGRYSTAQDSGLSAGHVTVLLGGGYAGIGSATAGSPSGSSSGPRTTSATAPPAPAISADGTTCVD